MVMATLQGIWKREGKIVSMYTLDTFSDAGMIYAEGKVDLVEGTLKFKAFEFDLKKIGSRAYFFWISLSELNMGYSFSFQRLFQKVPRFQDKLVIWQLDKLHLDVVSEAYPFPKCLCL